MVSITELMKYGSRRKIEAIAAEMGYGKAEEHPNEVLEAVKKRTTSETAHSAADAGTATGAEANLQYVQ
jgi:hypothetical protein